MTDPFDHLSRPDLVIACLERPGDVARYIEKLRAERDQAVQLAVELEVPIPDCWGRRAEVP